MHLAYTKKALKLDRLSIKVVYGITQDLVLNSVVAV